jgi:NAD(P)H-hydrate epimerase
MAVGGCGDILAGMITALLGIGLAPIEAAACGAWLHGAAGDLCAEELGQYGMLPSDMLNALPRLLK